MPRLLEPQNVSSGGGSYGQDKAVPLFSARSNRELVKLRKPPSSRLAADAVEFRSPIPQSCRFLASPGMQIQESCPLTSLKTEISPAGQGGHWDGEVGETFLEADVVDVVRGVVEVGVHPDIWPHSLDSSP